MKILKGKHSKSLAVLDRSEDRVKLLRAGFSGKEIEALFTEYAEYSGKISFNIYDIPEIVSEKVRAFLTREGTKARDFMDVYFICRRLGIKLEDVEACIIRKTNFAIELYDKYRFNLKEKNAAPFIVSMGCREIRNGHECIASNEKD